MKVVYWENNQVHMLDQRRLPGALEILELGTV